MFKFEISALLKFLQISKTAEQIAAQKAKAEANALRIKKWRAATATAYKLQTIRSALSPDSNAWLRSEIRKMESEHLNLVGAVFDAKRRGDRVDDCLYRYEDVLVTRDSEGQVDGLIFPAKGKRPALIVPKNFISSKYSEETDYLETNTQLPMSENISRR